MTLHHFRLPVGTSAVRRLMPGEHGLLVGKEVIHKVASQVAEEQRGQTSAVMDTVQYIKGMHGS